MRYDLLYLTKSPARKKESWGVCEILVGFCGHDAGVTLVGGMKGLQKRIRKAEDHGGKRTSQVLAREKRRFNRNVGGVPRKATIGTQATAFL